MVATPVKGCGLRTLSLVGVVMFCAWPITHAQTAEETRQDRRDSLAGILRDAPPDLVAKMRQGCAAGTRPSSIQKDRALGALSLPDAADYCTMALYRTARDGALLSPS